MTNLVQSGWEAAHHALQQASQQLHAGVLEWCQAAERAVSARAYEHLGFADPIEYLENVSGLRYRTVRRYLSIHEGILKLPAAEQPEARKAISRLGTHRAAALAPALGKEGVDWKDLTKKAAVMKPEALQEHVSALLGAKPRGIREPDEMSFRNAIKKHLPPAKHDEVDEIFDAGRKIGDTKLDEVVFLHMIQECSHWLAAAGIGR